MIKGMCTSFHKRLSQVAGSLGAVSLDENTVRTKNRTTVKSYIPSKPDPHGISFYALVGCGHNELFPLVDNGSDNKSPNPASERFIDVFVKLPCPLENARSIGKIEDVQKISALWAAQCAYINVSK